MRLSIKIHGLAVALLLGPNRVLELLIEAFSFAFAFPSGPDPGLKVCN